MTEVPEGTDVLECDLVGQPLDLGPTTLAIPDAGESVRITVDGARDDGLTAEVRTGVDGEISYQVEMVEAADTSDESVAGTNTSSSLAVNGCDDNYIGATRTRYLRSAWRFYIGDGGLPAAGTAAQLSAAIETAGHTWSSENSPCFAADGSRAPDVNYGGRTSTEADISVSGGETVCTKRDGTSTIDAGDLDSGTVAANCSWTDDSDWVIESDIRFNTGDQDFTYTPGSSSCSGDFDVLSVLTHEVGHTYGMKDKEASSSRYQTMYHQSFPCRSFARDLGRSDVRHLRNHYPPL